MSGFKEFRRFAQEHLVQDLKVGTIEVSSAESAQELDTSGRWNEAAMHYKALAESATIPQERDNYLIDLAQQCINLGRLKQAERILESIDIRGYIQDHYRDAMYIHARAFQKKAWIADNLGDFQTGVRDLTVALMSIEEIPEEENTEKEMQLRSTIVHFLGRAHYGLASTGVDTDRTLPLAMHFFNQGIERLEQMRKMGDPQPANEGYEHAWLARCYMLTGHVKTEREIDRAQELFYDHYEKHPESAIMSAGCLLRGEYNFKRNNFVRARANFEEAYGIHLVTGQRYPKGEAQALLAIAATHYAEGNLGATILYGLHAIGSLQGNV